MLTQDSGSLTAWERVFIVYVVVACLVPGWNVAAWVVALIRFVKSAPAFRLSFVEYVTFPAFLPIEALAAFRRWRKR